MNKILLARTDLTLLGAYLDRDHLNYARQREVFLKLLPQLTREQAQTLTQDQRAALRSPLSKPYGDLELTLVVLATLQHVGDRSDLERVRELTAEPPATPRMIQVRNAARECLAILQRYTEEQQTANTLLRASDTNLQSNKDGLLRPAHSSESIDPQQLLRAVADTPKI